MRGCAWEDKSGPARTKGRMGAIVFPSCYYKAQTLPWGIYGASRHDDSSLLSLHPSSSPFRHLSFFSVCLCRSSQHRVITTNDGYAYAHRGSEMAHLPFLCDL